MPPSLIPPDILPMGRSISTLVNGLITHNYAMYRNISSTSLVSRYYVPYYVTIFPYSWRETFRIKSLNLNLLKLLIYSSTVIENIYEEHLQKTSGIEMENQCYVNTKNKQIFKMYFEASSISLFFLILILECPQRWILLVETEIANF